MIIKLLIIGALIAVVLLVYALISVDDGDGK